MLLQCPPAGFFDTNILGLDLETSTRHSTKISDPHRDDVLLISLSNGHESIILEPGAWIEQLWQVLHDLDVTMVSHKADFDIQFLWSLGFEGYPAKVWDTLVMERVLTAGLGIPCGLEHVAWRYLSVLLDKSIRKAFAHHRGEFTTQQIEYAQKDVEVLIPIHQQQKDKIAANGLEHIAWLENMLVPTTAHMEWVGVGFDNDHWQALLAQELAYAREAEQAVLQGLDLQCRTVDLFSGSIVGINLNSWQQVLGAFNQCGIDVKSTGEKVLLKWLAKHPNHPKANVIRYYNAYKKHMKRIGFAYHEYVNPATGRIHPSYKQVGAQTGRYSCSDPNGQNVPARGEVGKQIRKSFVAQPGWKMLTADFAQQEMRLLAEASGDKELKRVCCEEDVHLENARRMYNDPMMVKSDSRRNAAKNAGFAMAYGASAEKVADTAGIPLKDAELVVQYTKTAFPDVERWTREQIAHADEYGWVATIGGRRRHFQRTDKNMDDYIDNQIRNSPIQGSAGDMLKLAMVYVDTALREGWYNARLVLTVHDELVIETPDNEVEDVKQIVLEEMERAGQYYAKSIPTPVDVSVAPYWSKGKETNEIYSR